MVWKLMLQYLQVLESRECSNPNNPTPGRTEASDMRQFLVPSSPNQLLWDRVFLSVKWGWRCSLSHMVVKHSQGLTPLPGMVQTLSSSHKDCFVYKMRSLISREVWKALQRLCFLPCALYSWLGRVSGGNRTARPQAGLPASFLQGQVEGKLVSHLTPVNATHRTYYFSFRWLVGQELYWERELCS